MARYNATEFEQQNVSCALLTGGRSQENATFSLSFLQGTTELIDGNVSLWEFEEALESLATIGDVEVKFNGCMYRRTQANGRSRNQSLRYDFEWEAKKLSQCSLDQTEGFNAH